jgi:hypothetical protein
MFRFNNRKDLNDAQRFNLAMSQIGAKRVTYAELTGRDESPRHKATGAGEMQIPLLSPFGTFQFLRRSGLPFLLLGPYNCGFGNLEQRLHPPLKVLQCLGPSLDSGSFME